MREATVSAQQNSKWGNGFVWPDGAHIAIVFNVSWETWPKILGTAENNQRRGEVVEPGAKYGRSMMPVYNHAYAETAGMQRLSDVWERNGIKASYYVDGQAVELYPELARKVIADGHEFLVQGWDHSFLWEQTIAEQTESIEATVKVFKDILGIDPKGYSASAGSITPETFDIIAARGFDYCCGFRNCDVPFVIPRKDRKLVGMNSYDLCDFNAYGHTEQTIRSVLEMWRDNFEVLYEEGQRGYPKMLAYGTHPFLSHGYRTRPLEETIRAIKSRPGVWITTRGEIADYVLENYPDMDISTFYPEAVASDCWYGLGMGVGGAEADAEARRYRVE